MTNPHRTPKPLSQVISELLDYDVSAFLCDDHDIPIVSDYLVGLYDLHDELWEQIARVRYRFKVQLEQASNDPVT